MQQKMFSIRDARGQVFHPPFYALTPGMAEREFTRLVNDQNSQLSQFPDDYDLYECGDYDDQTGVGTWLPTPQHVVKAVQVLKQKQ